MNSSLDHLFCVFGLVALPIWVSSLLSDFFADFILIIKANALVACQWKLVLICNLVIHSLVFESVFLQFL